MKYVVLGAGLVLVASAALAQVYNSSGALLTTSNDQAAGPVAASAATAVIPAKATMTIAGCVVGTTSATCLAAASASTHLQIQNVTSGTTNVIACTFGGTAILNDKSSFMLAPFAGTGPNAANWGGATGIIPQSALNCIATAASGQLYIEFN